MKQLNSLRVWLFVVLLLCFSLSGQAQFLRTSYFMEGSNQRMQLNPALMPGRGYLNIPVIGSLNATVNSSSLGYRDIMDIIENSDDSDYFMSNDFMNRLYNPQIQISVVSGTKRSIFRQKNKTKRSKKRLHTTLIKPEQKVNEDLCSGFIVS